MEKLYNGKGQVAVLISKGYGAGWSTWNDELSPMDKRYAQLILDGKIDKAIKLADKECYFLDGLKNCKIEWLDEGTKFYVEEHHGDEYIISENDLLLEA